MAKGSRRKRHGSDFERALDGYSLATAEILYWMPDHPSLLQSFVWQHYDIAPDYPELRKFLDHWRNNIEATLHSVRVACGAPLGPGKVGHADTVLQIN